MSPRPGDTRGAPTGDGDEGGRGTLALLLPGASKNLEPVLQRGREGFGVTPSPVVPPPTLLPRGDRGAAAQLDDHLLAVVQRAAVAQLLQRARRLRQHPHALPGGREEAGGQVAGGEQQGLGVFPRRGVALGFTSCRDRAGVSPSPALWVLRVCCEAIWAPQNIGGEALPIHAVPPKYGGGEQRGVPMGYPVHGGAP